MPTADPTPSIRPTDAAALRDLLERVRAATGPDREIDVALRHAFGPPLPMEYWSESDTEPFENISYAERFTASLDAALALVKRVLPEWRPQVSQHLAPKPHWQVVLRSWERLHVARAPTAPLAFLAALLTALLTTTEHRHADAE